MKKLGFLLATVIMIMLFAVSASAVTEGYYTYRIENGEATITDVDESIGGDVTIPSTLGGYNVTSIGSWAFERCENIKSIIIPEGVKNIDWDAFYYCSNVTSITIPESVTTIGGMAFRYCKKLTGITIPSGVKSIGADAFDGCESLKSITVDTANEYYSNDSYGVLFNKEQDVLIQYPAGNIRVSYTIPDGVTKIGNYAFYFCGNLRSVTIPDGVTSIGDHAFYFCDLLRNPIIPDSVTYIGNSAFSFCKNFKSFTIPEGVTSIGDSAFSRCETLKSITIPDGVTSMGNSAFSGCYSLTSIKIGDGVTSIGDNTFAWCDDLTSITIGDSVASIGDMAFYSCGNLTSITIPDSVTSIGDEAFSGCYNLTSITIGNGLTSIGDYTFAWSSLKSITVNTGNKYYSSDSDGVLFDKNKNILIQYPGGNDASSYIIPESVTSIGDYAFSNCDNLTSITIPEGVTSIGESAFEDCDGLTSIAIGGGVTYIGAWAFRYCSSLADITVDTDNKYYSSDSNGVLFDKDKNILIQYPGGNTNSSYVIPDGVTYIGDKAFENCNGLTNVTIPSSVTSIGDRAFYGYNSLTSITVDTNNKYYSSDSNGALFDKNKTILIQYPADNSSSSYVIPEGVTSIGEGALYCCYKLKSLTIPYSITSIDDYTINYGNLENITIPVSVTSIGDYGYWASDLDVYYGGTVEQWSKVTISGNNGIGNKRIHFSASQASHPYLPTNTIAPTCENSGYTIYVCGCGYSCESDRIYATGHDYNSNKVCVKCGYVNCYCKCHKGGIAGFFWRIGNFFNKLFKIKSKQMCACGISHY